MRDLQWLLVLLPGLLLPESPGWAQVPIHTVSGRVVQRGEAGGIPGATVRLSEGLVRISGPRGEFRFAEVAEGPYSLTVEAMGYRTLVLSLEVRSDTTLRVELEVEPIPLDPLLVRAGRVTVGGRVSDGVSGRAIPEARIRTRLLPDVYTARDGSFRIQEIPRGLPVSVVVEAYRYLTHSQTFVAYQDTTLNVALRPDSLAIALFQRAAQQLEIRGRGANLSQVQISRDYIERRIYRDLSELIRIRTGQRISTECLFIDEARQPFVEVLDTYPTSEIERIEIYGRGRMIRIYTQEFVAQNLTRIQDFPPVVYLKGGVCF